MKKKKKKTVPVKDRLAEAKQLEKRNEYLEGEIKLAREQLDEIQNREWAVDQREAEATARERDIVEQSDQLHDRRHEIEKAQLKLKLVRAHRDDMRGIIRDIAGGPVMQRIFGLTGNEDLLSALEELTDRTAEEDDTD